MTYRDYFITKQLHNGYLRPYCFCILKKPIDKNFLLININNVALKEFPEDKKIEEVFIVKKLPFTDIGKVDLKILEQSVKDRLMM